MKLALKFTLPFILLLTIVSGVFLYMRVTREMALFDQDFRRDHETMGADLAAAVAKIWHLNGEGAALEYVGEANASKSDVNIRWIMRGQSVPGDEDGRRTAVDLEAQARQNAIHSQKIKIDDEWFMRTYVPVLQAGDWLGTLELSESTAGADRYIGTSVMVILQRTLIIVVLTAVAALALGIWSVARPVGKLVDRARQIAAGDFSRHLMLNQSDELGDLANEINAMSDRLDEAYRKIAAESDAKIAALEQLRHADRLRTVGQLTSGIAHELGTPLNVVWERAKMIARDGDCKPALANSANVICEQSARMTKIIRNLLDFSRPSTPKKARADLRQAVRQTLQLLRSTIERNPVAVTMKDADEPLTTSFDVDQVQQVASNLIMNAVQAMPQGGVMTIAFGTRVLRPPAGFRDGEGTFVFFSVRDQGPGIPAENLPRIFEPFFTTKDVGQGTGLGLSVSLGIVREHDGWIDVQSDVGQGSCFTVYLPKDGAA